MYRPNCITSPFQPIFGHYFILVQNFGVIFCVIPILFFFLILLYRCIFRGKYHCSLLRIVQPDNCWRIDLLGVDSRQRLPAHRQRGCIWSQILSRTFSVLWSHNVTVAEVQLILGHSLDAKTFCQVCLLRAKHVLWRCSSTAIKPLACSCDVCRSKPTFWYTMACILLVEVERGLRSPVDFVASRSLCEDYWRWKGHDPKRYWQHKFPAILGKGSEDRTVPRCTSRQLLSVYKKQKQSESSTYVWCEWTTRKIVCISRPMFDLFTCCRWAGSSSVLSSRLHQVVCSFRFSFSVVFFFFFEAGVDHLGKVCCPFQFF